MARNTNIEEADVPSGDESEGEEGLNLEKVKAILGFFLRSPSRHPLLAASLALGVLVVTFCLAAFLPRSYVADVRVLAQRNVVLPTVETNGTLPPEEPTKGVADQIMRRDSIMALIKGLDLVKRWDATRPAVLRFKDRVALLGHGPMTEEQKTRALVTILEQRLYVSTEENVAFTVGVEWPDPVVARDLVNAAYQNFLDSRYDLEVSMFTERLKILEMRAQIAAQSVDEAIAALSKIENDKKRTSGTAVGLPAATKAEEPANVALVPPGRVFAPARAAALAPPALSDQDTRALEELRSQIRILDGEWRRRRVETESQLADARATLGPLHPQVIALTQKLEALNQPSPELRDLRAQEKTLVERLAAGTPQASATNTASLGRPAMLRSSAATVAPVAAAGASTELRDLFGRDDPPTAYARAKLQATSQDYNETLVRLQLARVELDVARAAFKQTYSIARPAEIPVKPKKPNVFLVLLVGIFSAALLTFLAPGVRDLLAGRLIEAWQVEMAVKIPVLGELPPSNPTREPKS